jgi:hypothetical protein
MFSRNEISNYDDDTCTIYTCPHCGENVQFYLRHFEKHWESKTSNLKTEDFRGAQDDNGFLDFYCPKCKTPTTVEFSISVGGKHGQSWYRIEKIINDKSL